MHEYRPPADGTEPLAGGARPDPALPPPFGEAARLGGVYTLFLLMLAGMIVVGGVLQWLFGFVTMAVVSEFAVILLPIVLLLRGRQPLTKLRLRQTCRPETFTAAILGVVSLAVLLAQLGYLIELVFPMPEVFKQGYLAAIRAESPAELVLFVFAAAAAPGFCEEVAFRGFFQQIFGHRYGPRAGILGAAALFAVMHLDPWHLLALFLIGAYLGCLFHWTGSLWVPVTAHFVNNALSLVLVYALPAASLSQLDEPPPTWALLAAVPVFLATLQWLRRAAQTRNVCPEHATPVS